MIFLYSDEYHPVPVVAFLALCTNVVTRFLTRTPTCHEPGSSLLLLSLQAEKVIGLWQGPDYTA